MTDVKQWSEAPAGTYSSFANDDRCYEVHYVSGDDFGDVLQECLMLTTGDSSLVDYDVNYDGTVETWVGVTCRDHQTL